MNIYIAALVVTAIVSLLGYLWLSMVAFKRSVPWGLLVLLLSPITAIVFAVMHWYDARKAFVVYITAFLLWAGSLVVILGNVGVGNIQELSSRIQSGQLTPAKAYQIVNERLQHPGSADMFAESAAGQLANAGNLGGETDATTAMTTEPQKGQTPTADVAKTAVSVPAVATASTPQDLSAQIPKSETVAVADSKPVEKVVEPTPAKTVKEAPKQETKNAVTSAKQEEVKNETEKKTTTPKKNQPLVKIVQPDPLAQKPFVPPPNTTRVRLSRISHYVGHYFIITLKDGGDRRGLLKQVTSTHLMLDRKLYGGNIRYKIRKTQVKSIKMLTRLPDER